MKNLTIRSYNNNQTVKAYADKSIKYKGYMPKHLNETEVEYFNPETMYKGKCTQNGNIFLVRYNSKMYPVAGCYVSKNFELLRRVDYELDYEIDFINTWESEWEIFPDAPVHRYERLYDVCLDPIKDLIGHPCNEGIIGFLTSLNANIQGYSYERWNRAFILYFKISRKWNKPCFGKGYAEYIKRSGLIYPKDLYLYGLNQNQLNSISEHFKVNISEHNPIPND